jgi:hypothetical protein
VAIKAAAADLFSALSVDDGRDPRSRELVAGHELASTQEAAIGAAQVPVIQTVTVRLGANSYLLVADNCPPFSVPAEYKALFGAFVQNILCGASGEAVAWNILSASLLEKTDPEVVSEGLGKTDPEVVREGSRKAKHPPASKGVRKAKFTLNGQMRKWGRPPNGGDWLLRAVGSSGCCLNTSCEWHIDEALAHDLTNRKSQSVWGLPTDPVTLAEDTVDMDHKLPAQPVRPLKRREDDAN